MNKRAMGQTWGVLLLAGSLLGMGGCFPAESDGSSASLSLPLRELGIVIEDDAVQRWLDWQDGDPFDPSQAFDLGVAEHTFALGIQLVTEAEPAPGPVPFLGGAVTSSAGDDGPVLLIDVTLPDCSECHFDVVLYYKSVGADLMETFAGQSARFDSPGVGANLGMDIYLEDVGRVQLVPKPDGSSTESLEVAARVVGENVIFPHTIADLQQGGVLEDLPLHRELDILARPNANTTWSSLVRLTLVQPGQTVAVELP